MLKNVKQWHIERKHRDVFKTASTRILYIPPPRTWLLYKELPTSCTFEFRQVLLVNLVVSLRRQPLLAPVPLRLMRTVIVSATVDVVLHCLLRVEPETFLIVRLRRHPSRTISHFNIRNGISHLASQSISYYVGIRQNPSKITPFAYTKALFKRSTLLFINSDVTESQFYKRKVVNPLTHTYWILTLFL